MKIKSPTRLQACFDPSTWGAETKKFPSLVERPGAIRLQLSQSNLLFLAVDRVAKQYLSEKPLYKDFLSSLPAFTLDLRSFMAEVVDGLELDKNNVSAGKAFEIDGTKEFMR